MFHCVSCLLQVQCQTYSKPSAILGGGGPKKTISWNFQSVFQIYQKQKIPLKPILLSSLQVKICLSMFHVNHANIYMTEVSQDFANYEIFGWIGKSCEDFIFKLTGTNWTSAVLLRSALDSASAEINWS